MFLSLQFKKYRHKYFKKEKKTMKEGKGKIMTVQKEEKSNEIN